MMAGTRTVLIPLVLAVFVAVMHTGAPVTARGLDDAPPPPAPVAGGWVPAEIVREIDRVDDGGALFAENVADGDTQSGPPATSAAPGTVLASDTFSNPSSGLLPTASSTPSNWKTGYVNGQYQIASVGSGSNLDNTTLVKGAYGDVSVSVDARTPQSTNAAGDETVRLYCRRQASGNGFTGYRFQFSPITNGWGIFRGDGNTGYSLSGVQYAPGLPAPDGTHHLNLTCSGSTISASVDGRQVGTYQDPSYSSGQAALGVGNFTLDDQWKIIPPHSAWPGSYDVRFSNLVLTQPVSKVE
jgi:hypothetical protein